MATDWDQIYKALVGQTAKRPTSGPYNPKRVDPAPATTGPSTTGSADGDYSGISAYLQYLQRQFAQPMGSTDPNTSAAEANQFTRQTYFTDLAESFRRYTQDFGEAQRRFDSEIDWTKTAYWSDFGEAKRRYDQEFPWLKKRDSYSIAGKAYLPNARFLSI